MKNLSKKQMLMTTLLSAATIGAAAIPAHAQDTEGDEIIVTGSRLNQANIVSSSPVVTIDDDLFDVRGTIDTVDLVNTLPSAFASQTTAFANGATGTSTLDLRGWALRGRLFS